MFKLKSYCSHIYNFSGSLGNLAWNRGPNASAGSGFGSNNALTPSNSQGLNINLNQASPGSHGYPGNYGAGAQTPTTPGTPGTFILIVTVTVTDTYKFSTYSYLQTHLQILTDRDRQTHINLQTHLQTHSLTDILLHILILYI